MLLSLSACSANSKISSDASASAGQSDSSQRRVIGRITAIDGGKVTLNAMEMNIGENGENFTPLDMPDGENFTPPDMPDGDEDKRPRPSDSDMPSFAPPGGGSMFSEGGEEITVDLSGVKITNGSDVITAEILNVGDMITVTLDSSGNAVSASVFSADGNWGGKKPGGSDAN